jgi:hypothetical protein
VPPTVFGGAEQVAGRIQQQPAVLGIAPSLQSFFEQNG